MLAPLGITTREQRVGFRRVARFGMRRAMTDLVLSIMALTLIALLLGALYLWRRGGHGKQAGLMVLLAVVIAVNIAIWTVPEPDGTAPVDRVESGPVESGP